MTDDMHIILKVHDALSNLRAKVGQAEQLYAELQCGIQHARQVRSLESGMEMVTNGVLGPGADLLRQLVLRGIGTSTDSVLSLQSDLEHLELKCRVCIHSIFLQSTYRVMIIWVNYS